MKDDFFDQIDQWSISVWSKNPWLKSFESGSDRAVFNINQLYYQWLEFILKNHGITTGPFSKLAEQKKIFGLVKHLNPYYFRSDEVRNVIDQTSTLPPKQKESLTAQITGFFRLMGKTSMNPVVLENLETLEEWWELFGKRRSGPECTGYRNRISGFLQAKEVFSLGTVFTEGPFQELANILGNGWSSVQNQKGQAKHGNGTRKP